MYSICCVPIPIDSTSSVYRGYHCLSIIWHEFNILDNIPTMLDRDYSSINLNNNNKYRSYYTIRVRPSHRLVKFNALIDVSCEYIQCLQPVILYDGLFMLPRYI